MVERSWDLEVGDRFKRRYGPFEATCEVVEVDDIGALLKVHDDARYVGFEEETVAPKDPSIVLADKGHDFIGRAHWHAVRTL